MHNTKTNAKSLCSPTQHTHLSNVVKQLRKHDKPAINSTILNDPVKCDECVIGVNAKKKCINNVDIYVENDVLPENVRVNLETYRNKINAVLHMMELDTHYFNLFYKQTLR